MRSILFTSILLVSMLSQAQVCHWDVWRLEQARKEYAELFPANERVVLKSLKGLKFEGSEKEHQFAKEIFEGREPAAWLAAAKNCKTVFCALQVGFGSEEAALRAMNTLARSGYIISLGQQQNTYPVEQIWSVDEIRHLDEAIRSLPPVMLTLANFRRFYRVSKEGLPFYLADKYSGRAPQSYELGGKKTLGIINIMDSGLDVVKHGSHWPLELVAHEVAHHFDSLRTFKEGKKRIADTPEFRSISGWSGNWIFGFNHSAKAEFVDDYSKTNPWEDFASAVASYLFEPMKMQTFSPVKAKFLKEKFFGDLDVSKLRPWPELDPLIEKYTGRMIRLCFVKIADLRGHEETELLYRYDYCIEKRLVEIEDEMVPWDPAHLTPECVKQSQYNPLRPVILRRWGPVFQHLKVVLEKCSNSDNKPDCVTQGALAAGLPVEGMVKP